MIGCYVCRVRGVRLGWCLLKQNRYGTNNQNNTFKNTSRNTSSNSNLRSVHIEHPHFEEMRPLQEIEHNSRDEREENDKGHPRFGSRKPCQNSQTWTSQNSIKRNRVVHIDRKPPLIYKFIPIWHESVTVDWLTNPGT